MSIEELEAALMAKGITANQARTLKIQIEGMRQALAFRREMNLVVSRSECRQEWVAIGTAISALLTRLEREVPQACLGLPISQSLPKAKQVFHEVRAMFADSESRFWKDRPEKSNSTKP